MAPPAPSAMQASTAAITPSRGSAISTQSGGSGRSAREATQGRPCRSRPEYFGFTPQTGPAKSTRFVTVRPPKRVGSAETPTTATLRGESRRRSAAGSRSGSGPSVIGRGPPRR